MDDAEARLFDLGNKAQRADWVHANFITVDTDQIAADADEELNTLTVQLATQAHRFDALTLPPELARKMLLVKLSIGFPAPSNAADQKELAILATSLAGRLRQGQVVSRSCKCQREVSGHHRHRAPHGHQPRS